MAVATRLQLSLMALESLARDLGTATLPHRLDYPPPTLNAGSPEMATGTGDWQFDLVWSDERTLTATSEQLDLAGVLTSQLSGATITMVEVGLIAIVNMSTTAASRLLVGGGANPAYVGLFGATGDIFKVGASGFNCWLAPLDGGGLTVTAATGDMLTIDAGAATITYRILVAGRSA